MLHYTGKNIRPIFNNILREVAAQKVRPATAAMENLYLLKTNKPPNL